MPSSFHSQTNQTDEQAMSVLILDDERFDRHRLMRLCSDLKGRSSIRSASNLADFGKQLEKRSFDLIIVDYALPDGTGLEALHLAHLCPRNLNTPTLMISGEAKANDVAMAIKQGCAGYLTKDGLTSDAFARSVQNALQQRDAQPPVAAQRYTTPQVAELVALCATRCAWDVKPMVSRMMRQLRAMEPRQDSDIADKLQALEQNCQILWSFLIEMERESGAVLLEEFVSSTKANPSAQLDHLGAPKRPSPFRGHSQISR